MAHKTKCSFMLRQEANELVDEDPANEFMTASAWGALEVARDQRDAEDPPCEKCPGCLAMAEDVDHLRDYT